MSGVSTWVSASLANRVERRELLAVQATRKIAGRPPDAPWMAVYQD
jgi:hypothetical protein